MVEKNSGILNQPVEKEKSLTVDEVWCHRIISQVYNEPISVEKIFEELHGTPPQQEDDLIQIFDLIQSIRNRNSQDAIIELEGMEGLYMTKDNYDLMEKEVNRSDQQQKLGKQLSIRELQCYLIILKSGTRPISEREIYEQLFGESLSSCNRLGNIPMKISRIRKKLGKNSISLIKGHGYIARRAVIEANYPKQEKNVAK